ncbi:Piso0_001738 [Millerozyma farinosa CBS 7064]|uniref:triacylglycerol lipase n=1 Tax=Pichia sorbitophila (strain ATCC MYA-4447 / BCRC 22081 / CBS 7064 / NBRC 10061 / NRRL Y-12695) TaxID=559304 RepID=G8YNY8_PICSO|nr:Piso0_001738 [Millerozyma farinosa CBS 7064]
MSFMFMYFIAILPSFLGLSFGLWSPSVISLEGTHQRPTTIDKKLYEDLFTYAHLVDIAYCVSNIGKIDPPFQCPLNCSESFPNMTLSYQWAFDNSVGGYISSTYGDIFQYNEDEHDDEVKKIIVSLRGTHSLHDSMIDVETNMVDYKNNGNRLPDCEKCAVHEGFMNVYERTLENIEDLLESEINECPLYEVYFMGHSLGGSVALLLALHFLDKGYHNLKVVTFGQPLVGNKEFVSWADQVLQSSSSVESSNSDRKYFRVIHKHDIVTVIPKMSENIKEYAQFDNQIYLNISSDIIEPLQNEVVDCKSGKNLQCISGDLKEMLTFNYYENHNIYFRKLGLCNFKRFIDGSGIKIF